jgi:hypothetical protein
MSPDTSTSPLSPAFARTADFDLLDCTLASDLESALSTAVRQGVAFSEGETQLPIFRHVVATAISRIHENGRASLFLRFLKDGPYEDGGKIPRQLRGKRLTDDQTASVITFIYSHMVNCFKGALTEMLAVAPCLRILRDLQSHKDLPREARLHVGDAVWSAARRGTGCAKGADLHILIERRSPKAGPPVVVAGVAEVKSYFCPPERLRRQLDHHLARARRGLRIGKADYSRSQISVGAGGGQPARISIMPAHWTLPRTFHFEKKDGRKFLHVDSAVPPDPRDLVEQVGPMEWRVTLRWSKEALDAAAYGMTFWFMEKVGEALYAHPKHIPKEWKGMTPAEAGQNAAKMMLYYAILRCRTSRENQRAIALYNSYGFGYMLGMNFRNRAGRREMLWPQDLDEILENGETKCGCRIT